MPRIVRLTGSLTCGEYRHVYDIDEGVGLDPQRQLLPNREPDVMFLQFLLKEAFAAMGASPPGPTLVPDGQFGPSTHYWILFFQMIKRGATDFAAGLDDDGFVTPFRDFALDTAVAAELDRSTIYALNRQLQRRFGDFADLGKHPRLPEMLRRRIWIHRAEDGGQ
jgi:hypothetical protein